MYSNNSLGRLVILGDIALNLGDPARELEPPNLADLRLPLDLCDLRLPLDLGDLRLPLDLGDLRLGATIYSKIKN